MNTICVYTTLFGNYETLNENLPNLDGVDYVCITDSSSLRSSVWNVCCVTPFVPGDIVRSQRHAKICPEIYSCVSSYEFLVYIDNCILVNSRLVELISSFRQSGSQLMAVNHSYRSSLYEEFLAVAYSHKDNIGVISKQLEHYVSYFPRLLTEKPLWTGILFRRPLEREMLKLSQIWYSQILRFSRRDQLSLQVAIERTEALCFRIDLNNFQSEYHQWPVNVGRKSLPLDSQIYAEIPLAENLLIHQSLMLEKLNLEKRLVELEVAFASRGLTENGSSQSMLLRGLRKLKQILCRL